MKPNQVKDIAVRVENTFEAFGKTLKIVDLDLDDKNKKMHFLLKVAIGQKINRLLEYKDDIAFAIGIDTNNVDLKIRYDIRRLEITIPFDDKDHSVSRENYNSLYNPISQIEHYLERVQALGGNSNFVIFELSKDKNYYIQIAAEKGNPKLYIEAAANTYLEKVHQLDKEKLAKLKSLGWNDPVDAKSNYFINSLVHNEQDRKSTACRIIQTFIDVYDYDLQTEFSVTEELGMKNGFKKKIMDIHNKLGQYKRVGVKLLKELKKKVDEEEFNV